MKIGIGIDTGGACTDVGETRKAPAMSLCIADVIGEACVLMYGTAIIFLALLGALAWIGAVLFV